MYSVRPNLRLGLALALAALDAPPLSEEERKVYKSRIAEEYANNKAPKQAVQSDMFQTVRTKA